MGLRSVPEDLGCCGVHAGTSEPSKPEKIAGTDRPASQGPFVFKGRSERDFTACASGVGHGQRTHRRAFSELACEKRQVVVNLLLTIRRLDPVNEKLTKMIKVLTDARSIRIKGRSFLSLALSPELPLDQWLTRLDDLAARSAGFFLGRPVVLDIVDLDIDRPQLKGLLDELASRNVRVLGIEGGRPSLFEPGMPPSMRGGRPAPDFEAAAGELIAGEPKVTEVVTVIGQETPAARATASIIVREPVRSGQSVIFPEGDVTVIGSVASGAEIIAGGSIHIYGALRGRALAGSVGNTSARIFCRRLEAELLAIDGVYKTADDMAAELRGQSVQLWLEDDSIMAERLN
ncbi:Septum site-determining protein MinC [Ensifer adhaerens]|nr:Septum site-determining protein MinC [Ensifer adhaerens]